MQKFRNKRKCLPQRFMSLNVLIKATDVSVSVRGEGIVFIHEFLGFVIFIVTSRVELWTCGTVDIVKFVSELTIK